MDTLKLIQRLSGIGDDCEATAQERKAALIVIRYCVSRAIQKDDLAPPISPASPATWLDNVINSSSEASLPQPPETTITSPPQHSPSTPTPNVNTLADQIMEILPSLMSAYPKGPAAKVLSLRLDASEAHIRNAMRDIDKAHFARLVRRSDSSASHLVPNGYVEPEIELSSSQQKVLDFLTAEAIDGSVQISQRDICNRAEIPKSSIVSILNSLEKKNRITFATRSMGGSTPSAITLVGHQGRQVDNI